MFELDYTGKFKKDVKTCQKRGYNLDLLRKVIKHYDVQERIRLVSLARTGTHSDLLSKK